MESWHKWSIVIGGVIAVIGQFIGADLYLPLIGGAIAVIVGLLQ